MEIESKFNNKNPANSNGDTPLHCAVGNGHLETCQWIIARNIGNDLNIAGRNGFTPLHIAALVDNLKIYQLIVKNVKNKSPKNAISKVQINPNSKESDEAQATAREFIKSNNDGYEKLQKLSKIIDLAFSLE